MRVKPTGWHFYVLSAREGFVWLVTVTAKAGKPARVVAVEGTYGADEHGEYMFTTTEQMFRCQFGEDCKKGLLTRANVNGTLDKLQDRMDGVKTKAGEEWQRM